MGFRGQRVRLGPPTVAFATIDGIRYYEAVGVTGTPIELSAATQFFEFVSAIAQSATDGQTVRLPPALMRPVMSDDVAVALADVAVQEPLNGTLELAGPEAIRLDELVRRFLSANRDTRQAETFYRAASAFYPLPRPANIIACVWPSRVGLADWEKPVARSGAFFNGF